MKTHPLHVQAEQSREEGNFEEALHLYDKVIAQYQNKQEYFRVVEALQGKFLTYKHLFLQTGEIKYAELGKQAVEESLKVAESHSLPVAFCLFSLGEASMLFKDYKNAADHFENSLKEYGNGSHMGDIRYHLGEALYRNGQKEEGKKNLLLGLSEIQQKAGELRSFIKNVWESGAHMRIAELLKEDNPSEAKSHFLEAKRIIEADPQLVLRKKQIERVAAEWDAESSSA